MWVFLIVFLLSRLFRYSKRIKELIQDKSDALLSKEQGDRQQIYEEENDFESQELKRLRIQEQKIKNVIAEEKLALDRQKRVQAKALHEIKLKKVAKEFTEELKQPATWFSQ